MSLASKVRHKIFSDIFGAPTVLFPIVGGLSLIAIGFGFDVSVFLGFVGLCSVLVGGGFLSTKLIFGLDKITENAYNYLLEEKESKFKNDIQFLQFNIVTAGMPDELYVASEKLKSLWSQFQGIDKEAFTGFEIDKKIESIFNELYETVKEATSLQKEKSNLCELTNKQKENIIKRLNKGVYDSPMQIAPRVAERMKEVNKTVEYLSNALNQVEASFDKKSTEDLTELRQDLDATMRVARSTEERMNDFLQSDNLTITEKEPQ